MSEYVGLLGLPLLVGVCVFAHHVDRRWWVWFLLCLPLTPLGGCVVLAILERHRIVDMWRKRND